MTLHDLVKQIVEMHNQGKPIKLITFDKPTFDSLKLEWKTQGFYEYTKQFLFGIPFKVVDKVTIE